MPKDSAIDRTKPAGLEAINMPDVAWEDTTVRRDTRASATSPPPVTPPRASASAPPPPSPVGSRAPAPPPPPPPSPAGSRALAPPPPPPPSPAGSRAPAPPPPPPLPSPARSRAPAAPSSPPPRSPVAPTPRMNTGWPSVLMEALQQLNEFIRDYNAEPVANKETKLSKLHLAYKKYKEILRESSELMTKDHFSVYRDTMQNKIFKDFQQHFQTLGTLLPSLTHEASSGLGQSPIISTSLTSFGDTIENMDPTTISTLLERLMQSKEPGYKPTIAKLYGDVTSEEAQRWTSFCENHSISYLGGANARNFLISSMDGSSQFILKLEASQGDKKQEDAIRAMIRDPIITPVFAQRQSTYGPQHRTMRNIIITEYCPGGSVESNACSKKTDSERMAGLSIYNNMGVFLQKLQDKSIVFSDMKNSNWLLDSSGKLRVADIKSFTAGSDGMIATADEVHNLLKSEQMTPPEFVERGSGPYSIDQMHSFMLGKNLYQYLTGCTSKALLEAGNDGHTYDFTAPLFSTDQGSALQALICEMVKPVASERLSLGSALNKLHHIIEAPVAIKSVDNTAACAGITSAYKDALSDLKVAAVDVTPHPAEETKPTPNS